MTTNPVPVEDFPGSHQKRIADLEASLDLVMKELADTKQTLERQNLKLSVCTREQGLLERIAEAWEFAAKSVKRDPED